ncbi:acetate--CoA ligase family protein [Tissierella praeacuta]|uniref:acetate--CoA ligase family protein n=1 Tax=Tissierella praeacuta TaxID=43131 RepID=UPI00333F2DD8
MIKFYNEYKSKNLLKEYGVPVGEYKLAASKEEAIEIAEDFGYPLVMKIVSDQIIHKTEAKGIKLNVQSAEEIGMFYEELIQNGKNYDPNAVIEGVIISKMVPSGIEVIIGALRDQQFGPVVMFGLGGVFVEVFKDVEFRMAPLTKHEAIDLIKDIKAYSMLTGIRGMEPVNIDTLADVLVQIGKLIFENENIMEIDLNPLICYDGKIQALDAVIGFQE